jgi:hypothetical protein
LTAAFDFEKFENFVYTKPATCLDNKDEYMDIQSDFAQSCGLTAGILLLFEKLAYRLHLYFVKESSTSLATASPESTKSKTKRRNHYENQSCTSG